MLFQEGKTAGQINVLFSFFINININFNNIDINLSVDPPTTCTLSGVAGTTPLQVRRGLELTHRQLLVLLRLLFTVQPGERVKLLNLRPCWLNRT